MIWFGKSFRCYHGFLSYLYISCFNHRWHTVTITIDADAGEATCYIDGGFDGYQNGLPLSIGSAIWEQGAEVWLGVRPPIDVDAFGRSDSDGVESKMHIMDVFLWGKCLSEEEAASLHAAIGMADLDMIDLSDDNWQWTDSPPRVCFPSVDCWHIFSVRCLLKG